MNIFGVGPTEMIVVLIVVLVLFGPDRLPELAKKIGGASREIRESLNSINDQMNNALETSMDLDKARMTPPQEVPAVTITNASENSILPQVTTTDGIPASTPAPVALTPTSEVPTATTQTAQALTPTSDVPTATTQAAEAPPPASDSPSAP